MAFSACIPVAAPPCTQREAPCNTNQQVDGSVPAAVERRSAHYQPSIWSPELMESLKCDDEHENFRRVRATELEEEVRCMFTLEQSALLELVDCIQRLGLRHRFEKEIRRVLDEMVSEEKCDVKINGKSLHYTALRFRLLRQHGYPVTQDVFKVFTDDNGKFPATLSGDIKGLLSLYEASYLGFDGEDLLKDAKEYSNEHLKMFHLQNSILEETSIIAEQVSHALEMPIHKRMERLEARWNIELYQKMKSANPKLLELSKLDFNMVQSTYHRELQDMSRWWQQTGLANRLKFARDRLMEFFVGAVGLAYEPLSSNCRKELTKVMVLTTILDDFYDVYGSLDELELFTKAVQRWDTDTINNLPDYMKLCFLALYNTVNETAYLVLKERGQNIIPILSQVWADQCEAFMVEAKWQHRKETPSFDDYLEIGWKSITGVIMLVYSYFLTSQEVASEEINCLEHCHDLLRWSSVIFRLYNDLSSSKGEMEMGESASSITCYMKENGVGEENARRHMKTMIDEAWQKLNRAKAKAMGLPFSEHFIQMSLNLARVSECVYGHGDWLREHNAQSKNIVASVILEPIPE